MLQYGRGIKSIAEQINGTIEEAQEITDNFFNSFPKAKIWMDQTTKDARKNGYVVDLRGRRRHLPDILLPKFEIDTKVKPGSTNFNPLLECEDIKIDKKKVDYYLNELSKAFGKKSITKIIDEASKDGIKIKDNSGFIAKAERQCVNARIQGSAASMTKQAMLNLYRDKELNDLGFRLLLTVHDELIGECPIANKDKVAERLEEVMATAAADKCSVPFKCDADISICWYENVYVAELKKEFNNYLKDNSREKAVELLCKNHTEFPDFFIKEYIDNKFEPINEYIDISEEEDEEK